MSGPSNLSKRVKKTEEFNPVMGKLIAMFNNTWSPENEAGIINLGVAENTLMADELIEFYSKKLEGNFDRIGLSYGDNIFASKRTSLALARFLTRHFAAHQPIEMNQIVTGNGIYSLMNHLFEALIDDGEGIVLSSPYYLGFDTMCTKRVGGRLFGVELDDLAASGCELNDDEVIRETMTRYERKIEQCKGDGVKVKVLLLTNPGNPIGRTLSRDMLLAYARLAEKHDLHLVSDEVYALSVFKNDRLPNALPFTSMLNIDLEKELGSGFNKKRVHVIHGMSKDFCSNGLRFATLVTQHNIELYNAMASFGLFIKPSSLTDTLLYAMLTQPAPESSSESFESYADWFIRTNQQRMEQAYRYMRDRLESVGLEVFPSNSGHFIWTKVADEAKWRSWDEELAGFERIFDGGVYIAPGSLFHAAKPGHLRFTFTVPKSTAKLGLDRFEAALGRS